MRKSAVNTVLSYIDGLPVGATLEFRTLAKQLNVPESSAYNAIVSMYKSGKLVRAGAKAEGRKGRAAFVYTRQEAQAQVTQPAS